MEAALSTTTQNGLPLLLKDVATLKRDTDIIMGLMAMFEGNDGRMMGCGDSWGNRTFQECFAKVREYNVDKAFSLEVHHAAEVEKMTSLESTIKKMSEIGLSSTSDFRRFENELSQIKHTLKGRPEQLRAQKETAELRHVAMLHNILKWKEEASRQLTQHMEDGKTTIAQAKEMWVAEARRMV